jgi:hypothetical protein
MRYAGVPGTFFVVLVLQGLLIQQLTAASQAGFYMLAVLHLLFTMALSLTFVAFAIKLPILKGSRDMDCQKKWYDKTHLECAVVWGGIVYTIVFMGGRNIVDSAPKILFSDTQWPIKLVFDGIITWAGIIVWWQAAKTHFHLSLRTSTKA